jgi:hypothetical protein
MIPGINEISPVQIKGSITKNETFAMKKLS